MLQSCARWHGRVMRQVHERLEPDRLDEVVRAERFTEFVSCLAESWLLEQFQDWIRPVVRVLVPAWLSGISCREGWWLVRAWVLFTGVSLDRMVAESCINTLH